MTTSNQISFYIPRLYNDYTIDDVANMFRLMYIGDVRRVDFVQIENSYSHQSAFVHMDRLYQNAFADAIRLIVFNGGGQYKLWIHADVEFWWLMKTTNPVADTRLNIHQVVENARILETKVVEQAEKIKDQAERIERLENWISKFDTQQKDDANINRLFYDPILNPNNKWPYPTHTWFTETDDKSSSMPSLVSVRDDDEDSMPSLVSVTEEDNDSMPSLIDDVDVNQTFYNDETDEEDDDNSTGSYSMPSLV